ncbi:hypothetical protein [Nocardioides panzhihuensis]|uniref:Uncharacterized protein n=1 Tax=Nocardioides panzhihuensis TaxID=860243 RepID=A0A7Z0DL57_9ACTN|nr:hypothetical protein [Nocardioides panzhihuensis]NYI77605.1 hypothetical protein [Nocardioides panzhihuensis]
MYPRHDWRPIPAARGEVRLSTDMPALRTGSGDFLRLHDLPGPGRLPTYRYLLRVRRAALERDARTRASRWPEGRRRVLVLGRGRLSRALAAELARSGAEVVRDDGSRRYPSADAVVDVREIPQRPDPELGERLEQLTNGAALLCGRREGGRMLIFPLMVDGSEATPDQVSRRRLAASPAAPELSSWLASGHRDPRPLRRATSTLTVARCLVILEDWAAGDPAVSEHRRVLRVVGDGPRERTHTVLGFDEPAPRPQESAR